MGNGFDAVRTFSDKHTIRGFEGRALGITCILIMRAYIYGLS